jgi:hypothetical protein
MVSLEVHCQHPLRLVQTQLLKRNDLEGLDGNIAFFVFANEHLTSSTWSTAARRLDAGAALLLCFPTIHT